MKASDIITHKGQTYFSRWIGASIANTQVWKVNEEFPAARFVQVRAFCRAHDLSDPSEDLFSFRDASVGQSSDA